MTTHCTEIPGTDALEFWPEIEPYVIEALAYDLYNSITITQLKRQLETGFARTLLCTQGEKLLSVTIVQLFKNTRDERILHVVCTAGEDSNVWLAVLVQALQDMAKQEQCDGITMAGRPGWARKLRGHGFKTDQVHMRLDPNVDIRREKREQFTLAAIC